MWTKRKSFRDRFVTLLLIPERTQQVKRITIPTLLIKFAVGTLAILGIFAFFISLDYLNILSYVAENKKLKSENFKLKQEMQQVRNKVESLESTMDKVRVYTKKLQVMTGQKDMETLELPQGGVDLLFDSEKGKRNPSLDSFSIKEEKESGYVPFSERLEKLSQVVSYTEERLSRLEMTFLRKKALIESTPSLVPLIGWISSHFGYRRNPYDGRYRLHTGIDIAAEFGSSVRAPASGSILFAGHKEGYGNVVVINHGSGVTTVLAHLSKILVSSGERVTRSALVGEVGSTGHSTGPHLHYEVRKNGVPINPYTFFSKLKF